MPWFKVDDKFGTHPKVLAAGNAATGLWVRAGCWSMLNLTDGHIPCGALKILGSRAEADRLVKVGLWAKDSDGYRFHDWSAWQPSSGDVEAERDRWRENQRRSRQRRGHLNVIDDTSVTHR